jgi:AcrR family transcriptional regulator
MINKNQSSHNRKKELIITATIKLWRQVHTINKVSLDEIAKEAGVSPTTIYNNFSTREGLVQAVIEHISREIIERMLFLLKSDLPFPAKMQGMALAKLNSINGLQSDIVEKVWTDPIAKRYLNEIIEKDARPIFSSIIEQGKKEGYIHPDIPPELFMLYFNILEAGGEKYKTEIAQLSNDKNMMLQFARLMYFGIFRKEFDLLSGNPVANEELK